MKTNNSNKEKVRQLQNKLYLTAKKCSSRRKWLLHDVMRQKKNVGKPCEGKLHARFDEGREGKALFPTLQGKGYSDAFAKHMQSVKEMLERTNPMVCITAETDILCRACPNNREGICTSSETVAEYDKQVLLRCDLSEGNVIPFREFEKTVFESILLPQKREEICGGCEWSALCHLNLPKDKSSHEKAEA